MERNEQILPNILHTIGNTPLIRLNRIPKEFGVKCEVLAKVEFFNPGGSIKDRMVFKMIEDAEKEGRIKPGVTTLIEPTSGNTGVGMAMACVVKGYKMVAVMSEKMSNEKVYTMKALGAEVVKTPINASPNAPDGPVSVAERLQKQTPNSVVLEQFSNQSNPLSHYETTAVEIVRQCGGKIDLFAAGAGTGGTLSGIGRYLKEHAPSCRVVGVDPVGSVMAEPPELNETDVPFFEVEGMGYDFVPKTLHRGFVDEWVKVTDEEAFPMARRLIREEGILSGGSSGANLIGALKACRNLREDQRCVVILADGVRNYMTKFLSDGWMAGRFIDHEVSLPQQWWHGERVSAVTTRKPIVIGPEKGCGEALELLEKNGANHLVVVNKSDEVQGMATDVDIAKWLLKGRVQKADPISSAPLSQTYMKVLQDTSLVQVHEVLENEPFVAVIDNEKFKGCGPTPGKFKVLGVITVKELLDFLNRNEGSDQK